MKNLLLIAAIGLLLAAPVAAQTDLGPLNLPTSFQSLPYGEDFEAAAGTVPATMAVTELDVATLLPDIEAWANIGQNAACINPFSGSFNLEMGMIPGTTNYHDVRNALVIGIDATGYTGDTNMSFRCIDGGEEVDAVDGVWVSDDGTGWYALTPDWGALVVPDNSWEKVRDVDWATTVANTSGQFYVAFVQEDNFPYLDLDGIGIDDIKMPQVPFEPTLSINDLMGGYYGLVTVSEAEPGASADFLVTFNGTGNGTWMGIQTGLSSPITRFASLPVDLGGTAIVARIVPASFSGRTATMQVVTQGTSGLFLTNVVSDLID